MTSKNTFRTSTNDVRRFLPIFDLPTYPTLSYNIRFWGLFWTPLPTLKSDVIYGRSLERLMKHALISSEQWQKDPLSRPYHHWLGYPCKPTLWPLKHTSLASIEADLFLRPFRKVRDVLKVPLEMLFSDVQSVERLRSPVDFDRTTRMSILIKSEISQIVP